MKIAFILPDGTRPASVFSPLCLPIGISQRDPLYWGLEIDMTIWCILKPGECLKRLGMAAIKHQDMFEAVEKHTFVTLN